MGIMQRAFDWMIHASNIEQQWNTVSDLSAHWAAPAERARVVESRPAGASGWELVLALPEGWPADAFRAGQWVEFGIEIDGVIHHRCYSVASAQGEIAEHGCLHLGVATQADGMVSRAVRNLQVNDKVSLSAPQGEFTWQTPRERSAVLVAGGSGITPIRAMLVQALTERDDITVLYSVRRPEDAMYLDELRSLAKWFPTVKLQVFVTDGGHHEFTGRIDDDAVASLCTDQPGGNRDFYLCGSHDFVTAIRDALSTRLVSSDRVFSESFTAPAVQTAHSEVHVHFTRSGKDIKGGTTQSLLLMAEEQGLKPKHGCRMGICQKCQCKASGTFVNQQNGEKVHKHNEDVRICIHQPVGEVSVDI